MSPKDEKPDSATNRVLELRARVNAQLEKAVATVVAELTSFSSDLKQALSEELLVILTRFEEFLHLIENELDSDSTELSRQLAEISAAANESILSAGRETRDALDAYATEAMVNLQALMTEQDKEIEVHNSITEQRFKEVGSQSASQDLQVTLNKAIAAVRGVWLESEESFIQTTSEVKGALARALSGAESLIASQAAGCRGMIIDKSKSKIEQLERTRSSVEGEINSKADSVMKEIAVSGDAARGQLGSSLEVFRTQMEDMSHEHEQTPRKLHAEVKDKFQSRLEDFSLHASREISALASDGQDRIAARCQQAETALQKLEGKYVSRLEHLLKRVDLTLSEVAVYESEEGGDEANSARRELKSTGQSLLNSVTESSGALKSKYRRLSNMLRAKIAASQTNAVSALEQQARTSQRRIQQSMASFREELARLEPQLWDIEEQGLSAARAASVYTATLLSLGDD